jgi:hypothetical protein
MPTSVRDVWNLFEEMPEETVNGHRKSPIAVGIMAAHAIHQFKDLTPSMARSIATVFLYKKEAPKHILKLATDELSRMFDVAVLVGDEELLQSISAAIGVVDVQI